MEAKVCTKCGIEKLLYDFDKLIRNKDGLTGSCRKCNYLSRKIKKYNGVLPISFCQICNVELKNVRAKYCTKCNRQVETQREANRRGKLRELGSDKIKVSSKNTYKKYGDKYRAYNRFRYSNNINGYRDRQLEYSKKRTLDRIVPCESCGHEIEGRLRLKFCVSCRTKQYSRNSHESLFRYITKKGREKYLLGCRRRNIKMIDNISDAYIKNIIVWNNIRGEKTWLRHEDIPSGVVESKRLIIQIKREIKKITNGANL